MAIETVPGTSSDVRLAASGNFGLDSAQLVINPEAPLDQMANDALCLLCNALEVFNGIPAADGGSSLPDTYYAGLYLLRQAYAVVDALAGKA